MMFNNNNYLPDLNHYPPVGQVPRAAPAAHSPEPTPAVPASATFSRSGNFRFLSPTQSTAVPLAAWVPTTCAMSVASAPGTGASWQHSVPTTMPWANQMAPHFTAVSSLPQCLPVYTMPTSLTPQITTAQTLPKSSIGPLRLKRRFHCSSMDDPDGPSSKKYLSEKMAQWFKQLHISPAVERSRHNAVSSPARSGSPYSSFDNGWQRFHEVEKRLEEDLEAAELQLDEREDREIIRGSSKEKDAEGAENGMVLTIPHEVKEEVCKTKLVLPVDIMKTISNPCMELVVWKPPDAILNNNLHQTSDSQPINTTSVPDHTAGSSSFNSSPASSSHMSPATAHSSGVSTTPVFGFTPLQFSSDMTEMEMGDFMEDDMDL